MNNRSIGCFDEKSFLKFVISKYAHTAQTAEFEDCILVDLDTVLGQKGLPYLVYSIDHPSFVRRPADTNEEAQYRFYGRWVAAVICGDVLAMGARPRGFSLDLAAPLDMSSIKLEWILAGIRDVLDRYGTKYEGGNFDANRLELVGIAWGTVPRDKVIRRQGAAVGDYIAVTTTVGYGWAEYLSRKLDRTDRLSEVTQERFQVFKELPIAPCEGIVAAAQTGGITSGMDLSDGLIEFLYTVRERNGNGLGVTIKKEMIEVTTEMEEVADKILKIDPTLLVFEPGYDTPLGHAYTVSPDKWHEVKSAFENNNGKLYKIGVVTEDPDIVFETEGRKIPVPRFWDDQFAKDSLIDRWQRLIKTLENP